MLIEARVVGSVKASQEGRELRGTGKRFGLQGREREAKTTKKKKKKKGGAPFFSRFLFDLLLDLQLDLFSPLALSSSPFAVGRSPFAVCHRRQCLFSQRRLFQRVSIKEQILVVLLTPSLFFFFFSFSKKKNFQKNPDRFPQALPQGRAQERAHRGALRLGRPGRRRRTRTGSHPLDRRGLFVLQGPDRFTRRDAPRHHRRSQSRFAGRDPGRRARVGHRLHLEEALHRHRRADQGRAEVVLHPSTPDPDVEGLAGRSTREAVWPPTRLQRHASVFLNSGAADRVAPLGQEQRAARDGLGPERAQARESRGDYPSVRGSDGRGRGARRRR